MASNNIKSFAFILVLNLVLFTLTSACGDCPSPYKPKPKPKPKPKECPPPPSGTSSAKCPRDALKLGVCANLLGGLVGVVIGTPPKTPCCTLIEGLADLEAAVCLCTAIKANVLGINLNIPLSLSLLLNVCTKNVPPGFQCA